MLIKSGRYSFATIEYTGMLSFSYVKRSGFAIKACFVKTTPPVKRVVTSPFISFGYRIGKVGKVFKRKKIVEKVEDRLNTIDAKLDGIDARLAGIEKHGVALTKHGQKQPNVEEKKVLNQDRNMLLEAIMNDNIQLRDG